MNAELKQKIINLVPDASFEEAGDYTNIISENFCVEFSNQLLAQTNEHQVHDFILDNLKTLKDKQ